jgi:hypothetical protein
VRTQKLMWRNIMRSTKSQKTSVLHYSIDFLSCITQRASYWDMGISLVSFVNQHDQR